jgi:HAD superfamily hydrolase (TIGR01549 family)
MIKGILFDFDGTLFHTEHLGSKSIAKVCSDLKIDFDIKLWANLPGKNREDRIKVLFPGREKKVLEKFNKEYENLFFKKIVEIGDSVKAIPILNKKYKLFIFSTKYEYFIRKALKKFNLEKYFLEIVGWESFENKKPNREGIDFILSKYNLKNDEIVLVGDSIVDKESATKANIQFIGFNNPHEKETIRTEMTISSHLDLNDLLKSF